MPSGRTAIYRLFDAHDNLLFIGRSQHPEDRVKIHCRCTAGWQTLIERHAVEWFPADTSARRAQRSATLAELPMYPDPTVDLTPAKRVSVYVYRLYDAADQLLYVGQTKEPQKRIAEHSLTWDVARFTLEECFTRIHARDVEGNAIVNEKPLHNKIPGAHGHKEESKSRYVNPWPVAEAARARYESGDITIRAAFADVMLLGVDARRACHLMGYDDGGWQLRKSHTTVDQMIELNGLL